MVLSNPGSLYRLLLLQSVSQGVAAGGSHKIETREMDSWIFVVVMTLFIFGDVTARRNPLWNKEQSETQQLEAIETMLKNYQGEQLFFFSHPYLLFHGVLLIYSLLFSHLRIAKLLKSQNNNNVGPSVWVGSSPPFYEDNEEDYYNDVILPLTHVLLVFFYSKSLTFGFQGTGICF